MQATTNFAQLRAAGQSIWLDNLSRTLITSGELQRIVSAGEATGITTNPAIFRNAIASGDAYRTDLDRLKQSEHDAERRYEQLAIGDVRAACDILRPVFDASRGDDGFVSLEVSPALAADVDGTVAAARRLKAASTPTRSSRPVARPRSVRCSPTSHAPRKMRAA